MLKALLVGLDGSVYCEAATQLAIRWAQRFGSKIVALGVIDEPAIRRREPVPLGAGYYKQHREETLLREARERVSAFLRRCEEVCGCERVQCQALTDVGEPWEQIIREAQRCDVIILGKQTYFHFETQEEPCDTLYRVLRNTPRPVVAVPERLPEGPAAIIAYDGSVQAARTLQLFVVLGLAEGRDLYVCSVDKDELQAQGWAEAASNFLAEHDLQARVRPISSSSDVAQVLLEEADKLQAGLFVMGAFGKPVWKEFFLGSVTQRLLRESRVPLFLYH